MSSSEKQKQWLSFTSRRVNACRTKERVPAACPAQLYTANANFESGVMASLTVRCRGRIRKYLKQSDRAMCLYFRFRTERARLWRPDLSAHFQFPNAKCGSPGPESELLGVLAGPAPPTPGGWIGLEADTEAGVALSCGTSNRG